MPGDTRSKRRVSNEATAPEPSVRKHRGVGDQHGDWGRAVGLGKGSSVLVTLAESVIKALGRSPGEGNDNPLQYSCLENSMARRAWRATVHGVAKSQTRLND